MSLTPEQILEVRASAGFQPTPSVQQPGAPSSLSDTLKAAAAKYDQANAPAPTPPLTGSALFADTPEAKAAREATVVHVAPALAKVGEVGGDIGARFITGLVNTGTALRSRIGGVFDEAIQKGQADANKSPAERAAGAAAETAHGVIDILGGGTGDIITNMISPFIPQKVKDVYGDETQKALADLKTWWEQPAKNPEDEAKRIQLHSTLDALTQKAKDNPEIAQSLGDAITVGLLGVGGKGADAAGATIEKSAAGAMDAAGNAISQGKEVISGALDSAKTAAQGMAERSTAESAVRATEMAAKADAKTAADTAIETQKVLNPSGYYTAGEKEAALKAGEISQKGKGIFAKEVVTPKTTPQTEVIQDLVRDGKVSASNLPSKNIEAINQEARAADSSIDELVNKPELNKPFTQKTINGVFKDVQNAAKKDLTFVSQSTEDKAYQEVLGVAREEIAKNPYNNSGLRKAVKAFNARMERILGSDIYSGGSESVGNARMQAAKDVRTALNNFLADNLESVPIAKDAVLAGQKVVNKLPAASEYSTGKAQGGALYKATLRREAQLLNARDEIAYRASKNIDKSKAAQFLKRHPVVRRTIYYGTAGLLGSEVLKEFGL